MYSNYTIASRLFFVGEDPIAEVGEETRTGTTVYWHLRSVLWGHYTHCSGVLVRILTHKGLL